MRAHFFVLRNDVRGKMVRVGNVHRKELIDKKQMMLNFKQRIVLGGLYSKTSQGSRSGSSSY